MLDRRRSTWLDRVGRQLAGAPPSVRFAVAVAGLIFFLGVSSLAWTVAAARLAPLVEASLAEAPAADETRPAAAGAAETFAQRIERVTDIANGVFLDLGLSRANFLTRYADPRQFGARKFDFIVWEVWVAPDFDVTQLLDRLRGNKRVTAENARLESERIDEKTVVVKVFLDGIQTHQLLFTNAAQEAPDGARVMLANAPADATKIDIAAIPLVKYAGAPRLAIVIDDIGFRDAVDRLFLTLPAKVTFSVLPYGPTSQQTAALARQRGHEVMLHLPMQPLDMQAHDPGAGKLLLSMSAAEIRGIVEKDLQELPDVVGVNNHMGSAFTRNLEKMQAALGPIKEHNLFFLDSLTIGNSVAFRAAKLSGVRAAVRNLFLDYDPRLEAIQRQVDLAGRIARAQGQAIVIGHPFQNTFQALQEGLPKLLADGIEITPVGQLAQ
jgi:polysaccharide deacetylase 2 family uncharacterized protein YibQ